MEKIFEQLQSEKRNLEAQIGRLSWEKDDLEHIIERHCNDINQLKQEEKGLTEANTRSKKEYEDTKARIDREVSQLNSLKAGVDNKLNELKRKEDMGVEAEIKRRVKAELTGMADNLKAWWERLIEKLNSIQLKVENYLNKVREVEDRIWEKKTALLDKHNKEIIGVIGKLEKRVEEMTKKQVEVNIQTSKLVQEIIDKFNSKHYQGKP